MSQQLIGRYLNDLSDLRRVSGDVRESVVRESFKTLLKDWGRSKRLIFVPEYRFDTAARERRFVDGALLHEVRVPFGYWEAKDEDDDLDKEIDRKFRRGYPQDNIIFEDSREAVLIQDRREVMRCPVDDPHRLEKLLGLFFSHERPEIAEFRKAVAQFKADLPAVLEALRAMIERAEADNPAFYAAAIRFLKHAQETINPRVTAADVREMLIQHILTEEIFSHVFDNADFHRQNNVARELYRLEETFFTGAVKHQTLEGLRSYYAAIRSTAALVSSHHEKQNFLKVVYENFYKVYNPKAADRLGVVYTPSEIVRFMVESADWLCQHHFGKQLIDRNVEILDPAAGTGTFIAELIEHFRGQPARLKYKYREELHANEVAILPYYVANLNIEATYAALTREYEEYPNLCFVDTLDNVGGLRQRGRQGDFLGALSDENIARIKRQNLRKISVIIGNPPYNANQLNENENNKNRTYPAIDQRIKETYIAASTAQKTKLYDMYARFFRWASDRIDENGIVAFVSNRSFVERATFDGFRKAVAEEFNEIWIVDLGGDVRADPRLSGPRNNVFGIQTGVAISFLVKRARAKGCRIRYACRPQLETAEEKLAFLGNTGFGAVAFEDLGPSATHDWINLAVNDFERFLPVADRATKSVRVVGQERAVFRLYSLGISTNRDEWLYDRDQGHLEAKVRCLIAEYGRVPSTTEEFPDTLKWSETLKRRKHAAQTEEFSRRFIRPAAYRPFFTAWLYQSPLLIDRPGLAETMFPPDTKNSAICFSDVGSRTDYCVLAIDGVADLHFGAAVDAYQQVPRFQFVGSERIDNITDWALEQFRAHYEAGAVPKRPITKDAIFHYVYGVLHDPLYREKYALNLKREFPRIPFYADFWRWADWGEWLMALHIGYESAEPWPLSRIDVPDPQARKAGLAPKALLRAEKSAGAIVLDSETQLTGIPAAAWDYRLGNRSALEWVLDQHKEKTPRDPTIREKFNTYRFADYKDKVIDLLGRVTRVSVETMAIVAAMRGAPLRAA
ncbi:MAG TPA: type ISP restriction/modification enzyme [Stellaceae bacterium]|nr:type ISP restriction/modification enzyme [Stellaceae bacterium]